MEVVISDDQAKTVIETLIRTARTGQIGDGKIFVSNVEEAIRIRTEEKGDSAV